MTALTPVADSTSALTSQSHLDKATYDPLLIEADAFDRANHHGTSAAESVSLSTDPAANIAASTAIVDEFAGVVITLTTVGNNQFPQAPTDTTAGRKFFIANASISTHLLPVNGEEIDAEHAINFLWDGTAWARDFAAEAQVANSVVTHAIKGSAGTLTQFTPVYISGFNVASGVIEVEAADNTDSSKMPCVGLVLATGGISNTSNLDGVLIIGDIVNVNTSSFSHGDPLYVGAGSVTATKPTTGDIQRIGQISRVDATNGTASIFSTARVSSLPLDGTMNDLSFANQSLAGSTNKSLVNLIDWNISHGLWTGGGITDDTDGTITVAAGTGSIRDVDAEGETLIMIDWAAEASTPVDLVDGVENYVYVDYNAASPTVIAVTVKKSDETHTFIYLGSVFRNGTTLHINTEVKQLIEDAALHIITRFKATAPFARESGGILSETGTRNIAVTAGAFWEGLNRFTTVAFDSSGADDFSYWYDDGGTGWTEVTAQSQIDNTQYDDGSGALATLANNRYGVHWVFLETDGHIEVLYGQDSYTLAQAENASIPDALPPQFSTHGRILGKVIIQKNAATFTVIESAFERSFEQLAPTDHANLINLQGGTADEYYHLTAAEHAALGGGGFVSTKVATRDLTVASGTQSITGVPFTPTSVSIIAGVTAITGENSSGVSDGINNYCIYANAAALPVLTTSFTIRIQQSGSNFQRATIVLTSDGCDIIWTKSSSPTGTADLILTFHR